MNELLTITSILNFQRTGDSNDLNEQNGVIYHYYNRNCTVHV